MNRENLWIGKNLILFHNTYGQWHFQRYYNFSSYKYTVNCYKSSSNLLILFNIFYKFLICLNLTLHPVLDLNTFCCTIKHCMIVFHINNKTTITCVHKWWKMFLLLIINPARLMKWILEKRNPLFWTISLRNICTFLLDQMS